MDRIYAITAPAWQPDPELPDYLPVPPQSALIAVNGTDEAYLVGEAGFADWDALTATLVGSWDSYTGLQEGQSWDDSEPPVVVGTPTYPVTAEYESWVRPLGNGGYVEDTYMPGRATGILDSPRWAGHAEPKFLQQDERYTDANSPFELELTRENRGADAPAYDAGTTYAEGDYAYSTPGTVWRSLQDDNTGNAQFGGSEWWEFVNPSGWGWRCDVLAEDPQRVITARAIAIYSDPECTAYLGTSGAFVNDGSGSYYCECPTALYTADKQDIYWALLYASVQEGFFTLAESDDTTRALFWADYNINPNLPVTPKWIWFTQYGSNYGGTAVNETLSAGISPDGHLVAEIYVKPNDRIYMELEGNARDGLDPTLTFLRIDSGESVDVSLNWRNVSDRYRSALIPGIHLKAEEHVGLYSLIQITWS